MKPGQRRAIGTVIVIVAASGLILHRLLPRDQRLLSRSTRIDAAGWESGRRFYNSIGLHWLSDDQLLFDRFVGVPPNDRRIIYRRNIRTGAEEKLQDLTRTRDDFDTEVVDSQAVSPDGKWFACSNRWGDCLLAQVDGKRSYHYPSLDGDCYRSVLWMADGRHWLENFRVGGKSHRLALHDVANPKLSMAISPGDKAKWFGHLKAARDPNTLIAVVDPNEDIGYNMDGSPPEKPADPRFLVTRFKLQARAQPIALYRIVPPPGGDNIRIGVSSQGDRIAWQVNARRENPMFALLHRIIPSIQPRIERNVEVWVCNIDGSDMHEVGWLPDPHSDSQDESIYLDLQWLPGSRKLSYQYNDLLYTVPAD